MRMRGLPAGTGWFTDKSKSGGGAMIDLGLQMLDLAWRLLGRPRPLTAFGIVHQKFKSMAPPAVTYDVEDAAFALLRFEGGKSLELSASWCSINRRATTAPPAEFTATRAPSKSIPRTGRFSFAILAQREMRKSRF